MSTLHQTIQQQIKEALEASSNPTVNGVDALKLCSALEIAVKALEEGKAARASQDVNQWVFALRKAEDALAQIEAALKT